jgi:hypothetical protein
MLCDAPRYYRMHSAFNPLPSLPPVLLHEAPARHGLWALQQPSPFAPYPVFLAFPLPPVSFYSLAPIHAGEQRDTCSPAGDPPLRPRAAGSGLPGALTRSSAAEHEAISLIKRTSDSTIQAPKRARTSTVHPPPRLLPQKARSPIVVPCASRTTPCPDSVINGPGVPKHATAQTDAPDSVINGPGVPKHAPAQTDAPDSVINGPGVPEHVSAQKEAPDSVINGPGVPEHASAQKEAPDSAREDPGVPKHAPAQKEAPDSAREDPGVPEHAPAQTEAPEQAPRRSKRQRWQRSER